MRSAPPKARDARIEGQILEYGHVVLRTSRREFNHNTGRSACTDSVQFMKKNGNTAVNKIYNPKNVKPGIPLDVDEVDSAMERFIRQKYQERSLIDGKPRPPSRNEKYTGRDPRDSGEGSPPPLPPKKGKIFGFGLRAASSAYPLSNPDRLHLPLSPTLDNAFHINKDAKSKGITSSMKVETDPAMETKLQTLRDMGFRDGKRNSSVLKGLGGDLERTIECLVRLGEGSQPSSRSRTPVPSPRVTSLGEEHPNDTKSSNAFARSTILSINSLVRKPLDYPLCNHRVSNKVLNSREQCPIIRLTFQANNSRPFKVSISLSKPFSFNNSLSNHFFPIVLEVIRARNHKCLPLDSNSQ